MSGTEGVDGFVSSAAAMRDAFVVVLCESPTCSPANRHRKSDENDVLDAALVFAVSAEAG